MTEYNDELIARYDALTTAYTMAQNVCGRDEFETRQRLLTWQLAQYILESDKWNYDHAKDFERHVKESAALIERNEEVLKRLEI